MASSSSDTDLAYNQHQEIQAGSYGLQPYQFEPRIPANEVQSSSGEEDMGSDLDDDRNPRLENSEDW